MKESAMHQGNAIRHQKYLNQQIINSQLSMPESQEEALNLFKQKVRLKTPELFDQFLKIVHQPEDKFNYKNRFGLTLIERIITEHNTGTLSQHLAKEYAEILTKNADSLTTWQLYHLSNLNEKLWPADVYLHKNKLLFEKVLVVYKKPQPLSNDDTGIIWNPPHKPDKAKVLDLDIIKIVLADTYNSLESKSQETEDLLLPLIRNKTLDLDILFAIHYTLVASYYPVQNHLTKNFNYACNALIRLMLDNSSVNCFNYKTYIVLIEQIGFKLEQAKDNIREPLFNIIYIMSRFSQMQLELNSANTSVPFATIISKMLTIRSNNFIFSISEIKEMLADLEVIANAIAEAKKNPLKLKELIEQYEQPHNNSAPNAKTIGVCAEVFLTGMFRIVHALLNHAQRTEEELAKQTRLPLAKNNSVDKISLIEASKQIKEPLANQIEEPLAKQIMPSKTNLLSEEQFIQENPFKRMNVPDLFKPLATKTVAKIDPILKTTSIDLTNFSTYINNIETRISFQAQLMGSIINNFTEAGYQIALIRILAKLVAKKNHSSQGLISCQGENDNYVYKLKLLGCNPYAELRIFFMRDGNQLLACAIQWDHESHIIEFLANKLVYDFTKDFTEFPKLYEFMAEEK